MDVLGLSFKKIIAFFMIFLIVSITPVFATNFNILGDNVINVNNEKVVGADSDFRVEISNVSNDVYFNNSGSCSACDNYSACDNSGDTKICYFKAPSSAGSKTLNFVKNDSGSFSNIGSKDYIVDNSSPRINISNQIIQGGNLKFDYTIKDELGASVFGTPCSGVKELRVFVNNNLEYSNIINSANCEVNSMVNFPISPESILYIDAALIDKVGNMNYPIDLGNLTMDAEDPLILGSFEIMQGDIALQKIALNPPQIPLVDVVFLIDEQSLLSVMGDLKDFNNIASQNFDYGFKHADCSKNSENLYECKFRNIRLHPGSGRLTINLTILDAQNNVLNTLLEREYEVVTSANEVVHIGPEQEDHCDENNNCFINNEDSIIEVVIKSGEDAMFETMHVPIKVGQISSHTIESPFRCNNNIDNWVCSYLVQIDSNLDSGSSKWLYIDHSASDDYGVSLEGITKKQVTLDLNPPVIKSVKTFVNNQEVQDFCLKSTDTLNLEITASDDLSTELKIWSDTDATLDDIHEAKCERNGNNFLCKLDITHFISIAEEGKELTVNIEDLAGNINATNLNINLCVANLEDTPTFVAEIKKPNYNDFVDRRVATFKYWKHYIPLEFRLVSNNAHLIDYEITNCEAYDSDAGLDYVYGSSDSYYFINKNNTRALATVLIGSESIYSNITDMDLVCEISFKGRIGGTYFRKTQDMNFSVNLNFNNPGISGPDQNINEEIENLKEDLIDLDEKIKRREVVNNITNIICQVGKAAGTANSVLQSVDAVLKAACAVFAPVCSISDKYHDFAVKIFQFTEQWLWPAGNIYSNAVSAFTGNLKIGTGIFIKGACYLYNCEYYDVQDWVEFSAPAIGNLLAKDDYITFTLEDDEGNIIDTAKFKTQTNYLFGAEFEDYVLKDEFSQKFDFDTWIVNPYRSVHYDTLCIDAQIFNIKKEKQIKCMYINCLESIKETGLDKEVCTKLYKYRDCLYLESAQVDAHGPWGSIWGDFVKAASAALFGTALSIAFQTACGEYYDLKVATPYDGKPWQQYGCILPLVLLTAQDFKKIFSGTTWVEKQTDLGNACSDISY